jgi:hypothetical protein
VVDPHHFRTNDKAEKRHKALGIHRPGIPDPPPPPKIPQSAKAPSTMPLKRRNTDGGFATPGGSTVLTGPSGIQLSQMNLGSASALGG